MLPSIKRRQFSLLLAASALPSFSLASNAQSSSVFLSAASNSDDQHWVTGFVLDGDNTRFQFKQALPSRAHHIAVHEAQGLFVVVARRPGTYLMLGDLQTGEILQEITVPTDRHLFGHGIFSHDGEHFYSVESDFQNTQTDNGRMAIWSVNRNSAGASLERINEFSTYGVGPHEFMLMPDKQTLVVANGGIRTHPDSGREKLNLESMKPSLAYINSASGELLEQHYLAEEFHQASIRHLDVNAKGKVVLAMQYEGEPFDEVPLLASHKRGGALELLRIPLAVQQEMNQYVGSIKFDSSGRFVAASCPRGNMITFWDVESSNFVDSLRSRDGCGVSAIDNGFVFTSGTGRISAYDILSKEHRVIPSLNSNGANKLFWDNHLTVVS